MRRTIGTVLYGFHIMVHPFDGFWDLKHEKKQTLSAALAILLLTVLTVVLKIQAAGFLFVSGNSDDINLLLEILTVILPLALWVTVNWSITTLFDGKASMKVIFISTVYALMPLVVVFIPQIIISHFLTMEEGVFYYVADGVAALWCAFLLLTGNATVQDYTMFKTVVMAVCTIVGILALLFLASVFYSAASQLIGFFATLVMEIRYW